MQFSVKQPNQSRGMNRPARLPARSPLAGSRDGVALVITMILLAVIATLAIAFLALTHRETGAVGVMQRTTDAEQASESALQRSLGEIGAPFVQRNAVTNGLEIIGPGMMVSVAWNDDRNVTKTSPPDLLIDPSPPVFVDTNRAGTTGPFEDRFYLDLNRNGHFEKTGYVPMTDQNFREDPTTLNYAVGDPQWIGVLADPTRKHAADNRFISRYAFLVQPIGRSLDVNWIHNQALGLSDLNPPGLDMGPGGNNGYFRNQGVGGWELNLAAFLADLNTNYWGVPLTGNPYTFVPLDFASGKAAASQVAPASAAFNDARELLRYRYMPQVFDMQAAPARSAHLSNDTFAVLFPGLINSVAWDQIDLYADGPLGPMISFDPIPPDNDNPGRPWPGTDSKRHFFSVHDFFDPRKLPERQGQEYPTFQFRNNLSTASAQGNSYDRYTFYRMLAQMGTDSAPEEEDKINLNYVNIPSWRSPFQRIPFERMAALPKKSTAPDIASWERTDAPFTNQFGRPGPELFFITVVTNLLAREKEFVHLVNHGGGARSLRIPVFTNGSSKASIPVDTNYFVSGPLYSGRIHQILQLAANIHDATTGPKKEEAFPYFPSVFRPRFETIGGNVYITDYSLVESAGQFLPIALQKWRNLERGEKLSSVDDLVYGVPLIIGARKGLPNFNEFAMLSSFDITRRLKFRRVPGVLQMAETNQVLTVHATNYFAIETWNAYTSSYPRRLQLIARARPSSQMSNNVYGLYPVVTREIGVTNFYPANSWMGGLYVTPALTNQLVLNGGLTNRPVFGQTNSWSMNVTNDLMFLLVDIEGDRIIDAVTLDGPRTVFDITKQLETTGDGGKNEVKMVFNSGRVSDAATLGIRNQVNISQYAAASTDNDWRDYSVDTPNKAAGIQAFTNFFYNPSIEFGDSPFVPYRRVVQTNYYRVNDPLVHYTVEDLSPSSAITNLPKSVSVVLKLGSHNPESIAWNNGNASEPSGTAASRDPTIRDPGIFSPDWWDFPTNRFPSVGWLGRVHRGTPWQTIYFKSSDVKSDWLKHVNRSLETAVLMKPVRDWNLLDLFSTVPHPNATRGRLSVNQTNLAAWSAVLSGIVLSGVTNDGAVGYVHAKAEVIQPAALADPVATIVAGINAARAAHTNGQFHHFGDILSVPQLTFASPFLKAVGFPDFNAASPTGTEKVFDADYERIPEQILGLIKLGEPRFVVYSWGQSLKPANRNPTDTGPSVDTRPGPTRGLVSNYQITGEMATRAVVRVDFDPNPNYDVRTNAVRFLYGRPHVVVESFNILPNE